MSIDVVQEKYVEKHGCWQTIASQCVREARFLQPEDTSSSSADLSSRVKDLEDKVAALESRLERIIEEAGQLTR